jgi:zinc protease
MHILITLLLSTSFAEDPTAFPYEIHRKNLENGLTILAVPMETPNVANVRTWMAVGSRDELDPGRTGFAHFFEHLMFYDTKTVSRLERESLLKTMGAEENAWTWFDDTVYHATLSSTHVQKYIEIEGDRFQNLQLTDDMVRKEAGAVYGELRKSQASPVNRLYETIYSTAFTTHTYHHDTIGYEADIADMPSAYEYSSTFFSRYYRPNHAALIVVGDINPKDIFAWAESSYGSWSASETARPPIPQEPLQEESRIVHVEWPTPTAFQLAMAWKSPPYDPANRDFVTLNLLSSLLMGDIGPLERRLVREEKLAYSVYGDVDAFVDTGLFKIIVELKDPSHQEQAKQIIWEEIKAIQSDWKEAPNLEDRNLWFENTRSHDRYQDLTSLDTPDAVGSQLGWSWRRTGETNALDVFYKLYDTLTPADVSNVAKQYLKESTLTLVTLGHTPAEPEKEAGQ